MTAEDTDNKWSHVHTLDRHRVQPNLSELNGKMERRRNGEVCEKKKRVSSMKDTVTAVYSYKQNGKPHTNRYNTNTNSNSRQHNIRTPQTAE